MDLLSIGDIIRLTRCNSDLLYMIKSHDFLWKTIGMRMGYKKNRSIQYIQKNLYDSKWCRECAVKKGLITFTRLHKPIYICMECANEKNGYSELVCRAQIFEKEGVVWSKKRRALLSGLHVARKTTNNKILYWGFEWRRPCKYLIFQKFAVN
tara:strand:+ start:272 stop:727 length:456 start_codon:yes stop_codon:yes gene_type:complete